MFTQFGHYFCANFTDKSDILLIDHVYRPANNVRISFVFWWFRILSFANLYFLCHIREKIAIMSDSDDDEQIVHRFKIVKFIKRGRKSSTKEIDIIPSTWINWDKNTKRLKVPFLPPSYTKEGINNLHDLVKNELEAPESWPLFSVDIVGQAKTYLEAVDRLMLLDRKETDFSHDSEDDKLKIKKAQAIYQQKRLKKNAEEIKDIFNKTPTFTKKSCGQSDIVDQRKSIKSSKSVQWVKENLTKSFMTHVPAAKTFDDKQRKPVKSSKSSEKENLTKKDLMTHIPTPKTFNDNDPELSDCELEPSDSEPEPSDCESQPSNNQRKPIKSSKSLEKETKENFTTHISAANILDDSESEPSDYEPEPSKSQNSTVMLLDAELPVTNEDNIMEYVNDKEPIPVIDINLIYSKLLLLENESIKTNKKLDLISIKLESLLYETKIIKNKTIHQASSNKEKQTDNMLKKYNITLPVKTNEEFKCINNQLQNDVEFRNNFCEYLYRYIDFNSTLTKNITMLLKLCITRDVAITYTATKVTLGKALMKDEPFYSCIEDLLLQKEFKGERTSRNHLIKAMSAALSNSKDWEGHRKDRMK